MTIIAFVVTVLTTIFAIMTSIINFGLLYKCFVSKELTKSTTLTLFYIRFALDGLLGIGDFFMMLLVFFKLFEVDYILAPIIPIVFIINWPIKNLLCIRAILVIIINLDRDFAVFFPVSYYKFRKNFANSVISVIPFCYSIIENWVLWGVCEYQLRIPPNCVLLRCVTNECYITYGIRFEVVSHILIAIASLALLLKLFILNRCLLKSKSEYLEKANYLALIDTCIIVIFDVLPAAIIAKNQSITVESFGNVFVFGKITGFALEGYLVYRTLEKVQGKPSNLLVFRMKISNQF